MRTQRGVALVIAVLVLTVIGALVAAAFFAGIQEYRMSESIRRQHQALGAGETALAELLRQWPDAANALDHYPKDSLVLASGSVVIRRVSDHLYLASAPGKSLGMLIVRPASCVSHPADGVEMTQSNCQSDSSLQKVTGPVLLQSRSWAYLF